MSQLISVKAVLWPQASHFSCWPPCSHLEMGSLRFTHCWTPEVPRWTWHIQKFLERVTADGLVVSVVVTSFNPRDHPGRQELGLLHLQM